MSTADPVAPGDLEEVRRFVNTLGIEDAVDDIATPEALAGWMRQHCLLDPRSSVGVDDVRRAQQFREDLRDCLLANHERLAAPPSARAGLNEVAVRAKLSLMLDDQGQWQAQPCTGGADGALGRLLAIVVGSMTTGDWQRLKACLNDTCRWAFYDHSRARTGRWCSMQVCGNRAKQETWRNRQARNRQARTHNQHEGRQHL